MLHFTGVICLLVGLVPLSLPAGILDCKKVFITLQSGSGGWTSRQLGEDTEEQRRKFGWPVLNYFEGDDIYAKLFLGSGCRDQPLSREDLVSTSGMLSVEIYRLLPGTDGRYKPDMSELVGRGRLKTLEIDVNDAWNKEHIDKTLFYKNSDSIEGLVTNAFKVNDVVGKKLSAGYYMIKVVIEQHDNSMQIMMNSSKLYVGIYDVNTPRIKALKLCLEGYKMISDNEKNYALYNILYEEKIAPAIDIDPDPVCAYGLLSEYHWFMRNKDEYVKARSAFCERQKNVRIRKECKESIKTRLTVWDDPRWR